jgi:hypothetical protein
MRAWACGWWRIRQHIFLTLKPPLESLHRVSSSDRAIPILNFTPPTQESKRTVMASQCSLQRAFRLVSEQGWASRDRNKERAQTRSVLCRESMPAKRQSDRGSAKLDSSGRRASAFAAPRSIVKDEMKWAGTRRNLGQHQRLPSDAWRPELSECYWLIELAVAENALLAFPPIKRTVPTTMIRITASITAYSAIS